MQAETLLSYAIVQSGGRQYKVKANDTLKVDRLAVEAGKQTELRPVLAISDGKTLTVGRPTVEGAKVLANVVSHVRGEKLVSFKQKRRKGYHRKKGHRQELTVLKVLSVG